MSAYQRVLDALHDHGSKVVPRGDRQTSAQCPAHDDRNPSLSVTGIEGQALVYCHAGCHVNDVLAALGITTRDLFDQPNGATYRYDDGRVVHRTLDKTFPQSGNKNGRPTLYRLDRVLTAVSDRVPVYLVEGEKDVHALESLGAVATTAPMGAANWRKVDASPLTGAHVVVVPDQDDAGSRWQTDVLGTLDGVAATVRVVRPATGKDAADHVAADHHLDDLVPVDTPPNAVDDTGPDDPDPEMLPAPSDPMAVARALLHDFTTDHSLTLRSWRGGWMQWKSSHWAEIERRELESTIYQRLEHATYLDSTKKVPELRPWEPNRRKVGDVLDAFAAVAFLAETIDPPTWVVRDGPRTSPMYRAREMVACTNGLLHVGTRTLIDLTPTFFNRVAVPFDYNPDAPEPARWLEFLHELWPDDADAIAAVQEFFGYVLSGRTDLHKILLLIGPTRSGKGTIARVLAALVGKGNAAGPTLASLGTNFGLSPLLGKPLAVVSDARLGGANVHQVVERLLSVSGEDMLTVDRKYREPWTGKMPTRFLVLSNELPRFGDASGAIAHRFIVATMHESFLGREDTRLTDQLLGELPGILGWALAGLDRLAVSPFTEPASSTDAIIALQDLVSPVAAFVRDACTVGAGLHIAVAELFTAWKQWAEDNGHRAGSAQTFGRDLRAVVPQLRMHRPRDGEVRERRYFGLRLSTADIGLVRGPSRTTTEPEVVVRDGPRPQPLSATAMDPACPSCADPLDAPPTRRCSAAAYHGHSNNGEVLT